MKISGSKSSKNFSILGKNKSPTNKGSINLIKNPYSSFYKDKDGSKKKISSGSNRRENNNNDLEDMFNKTYNEIVKESDDIKKRFTLDIGERKK